MKLQIEKRDLVGKKVKHDRNGGKIPAAMFGPKFPSRNVWLDDKEFRAVLAEAGFSNLVDTEFEGEKEKILIKEIQTHPITNQILHVSLYQVDTRTPITAEIPVVLTGEAPAVDLGLGFLVTALDAITVHCLPKDLPSEFSISLESLNQPGDNITIADIVLPEGVTLDTKMDPTTAVVYIETSQKMEADDDAAQAGTSGTATDTAEEDAADTE